MSGVGYKKTVKLLIESATQENAELENRASHLRELLSEILKKKEANAAKVEAWNIALEAFDDDESESAASVFQKPSPAKATRRRMRLGVKKRIIYSMVNSGLGSEEKINEILKYSDLDIDSRYIREVVRTAIAEGDYSQDENGNLNLTASGREIFNNAPLPKGWKESETLLDDAMRPDPEDIYNGL